MQATINRNLLKYSAGLHICCPSCGEIADFRRWVIWESPAGRTGGNCTKCWQNGLDKIHDDHPEQYLQSIGWTITKLPGKTKKC